MQTRMECSNTLTTDGHIIKDPFLNNAREVGASLALVRFLIRGLEERKVADPLDEGNYREFTVEDLRDFAVELQGRLNRIKI